MRKYLPEQKDMALRLFEEGFTARQIFEDFGIPIGTLNRWKAEAKTDSTEDKDARIEYLETQVSDLITQLKEVKEWVDRKKRAEAKERDYAPPTTGFQLKRAGTI